MASERDRPTVSFEELAYSNMLTLNALVELRSDFASDGQGHQSMKALPYTLRGRRISVNQREFIDASDAKKRRPLERASCRSSL